MGAADEEADAAGEAKRRIVHRLEALEDPRVHLVAERGRDLLEQRVQIFDVVVDRAAGEARRLRELGHARVRRPLSAKMRTAAS